MKKNVLLLFMILFTFSMVWGDVLYEESFETDGNGTRYTLSGTSNDGSGDYFERLGGGTNPSSLPSYTNADGSWFIAAEDVNGEGATEGTIFFEKTGIDISGETSLNLSGLFASGAKAKFDATDYVKIYAQIDAGGYVQIGAFEADIATGYNSANFGVDMDGDGIADGPTYLTTTFTNYTFPITVSGSTLDIKINVWVESGDEEFAFDYIQLSTAGGTPTCATPTFDPAGGNYNTTQSVEITCDTPSSTIYYTTDGSDPDNTDTVYSSAISVSSTTTIKAIAYATGYDPSSIATATYTFPTEVANIAAFRAGTNGTLYKITGEVVVLHRDGYRNRHFVRDASGSLTIWDESGNITTDYSIADGVTGFIGVKSEQNSGALVVLEAASDPGTATSSSNNIDPVTVTLASLSLNDTGNLVTIEDVTFGDTGTFANGNNYSISDGSKATLNFRTDFYNMNYIGLPIPQTSQDLTVIVGGYSTAAQLTARSISDFDNGYSDPTEGDLIITEVCGDGYTTTSSDGFVEIMNQGSSTYSLNNVTVRYHRGSVSDFSELYLFGTIDPDAYIIITTNNTAFTAEYGFAADYEDSGFTFADGSHCVEVRTPDTKALIDGFNMPNPVFTWDPTSDYERTSTSGGENESSWTEKENGGAPATPAGGNDNPLAVTLSQFYATYASEELTIFWTTASESNNQGWNVYRSETDNYGQAVRVNSSMIEGQNNSSATTDYEFKDGTPYQYDMTYYYWIESIDFANNTELYGPTNVFVEQEFDNPESPEIPEFFGVKQNYPNPFNPSTEIMFRMPNDTHVEVSIYNTKGEFIKTIFTGAVQAEAVNQVTWDGTNYENNNVASGVYLYKVISSEKTYLKKMMLIK